MSALDKLQGQLLAVASADLVGQVLAFAGRPGPDVLEAEPLALMRQGAHTKGLVVATLDRGDRVALSADTARHVALLLEGMGRPLMALEMLKACDEAEATAHEIDGREA